MNILAPSMLSVDFGHMEKELKIATEAGTDVIHVDVMDGNFVPNISFGPPVIKYVKKAVPNAKLDVHAMIIDPIRYLETFFKLGIWGLTIHYEATDDIRGDLAKIRDLGIRAGVAISPDTPVSAIEDILDQVDMVLAMSVYPGFGGQSFIEATYQKLRELRRISDERGLNLDIEVDGGVSLDNLESILDAGANVIVAGSAIFGPNTGDNVIQFKNIMDRK
ncbi:MAG: ribulose-phosphate 3-epimerase [Eubacterium sp.]|nr:ribulose-phosphate 3-epimerase [Eubacterium sp.]